MSHQEHVNKFKQCIYTSADSESVIITNLRFFSNVFLMTDARLLVFLTIVSASLLLTVVHSGAILPVVKKRDLIDDLIMSMIRLL